MRFIREIPPAERLTTSAGLAELTLAQLIHLAAGGRACPVAIGSKGAWRPCCRAIDNSLDVMCAGHLAAYRAEKEEAEHERGVMERALREELRATRAARRKAIHRRPPIPARLVYTPHRHPAAEHRAHARQIGEPHADLGDLERGHIAMGRLRLRVLDEMSPPSEWPLTPGLATLRELGRRRMLA